MTEKIDPHKITKPIQLMAVWFVALLSIDSAFLFWASKLSQPSWMPQALVIAAIAFVPFFVGGVFLMQTVFRKELQDDPYYSQWLTSQKQRFKNFIPENIPASTIMVAESQNLPAYKDVLEDQRINKYQSQQGLFLVHSWRPSRSRGQVADIVIWLHQHGDGPLNQGGIEKVEYQLGKNSLINLL